MLTVVIFCLFVLPTMLVGGILAIGIGIAMGLENGRREDTQAKLNDVELAERGLRVNSWGTVKNI